MSREQILKKAYQCIDEVYPDSSSQDITAFNIDTFLDQAAKIIVKIVPPRVLGGGSDMMLDWRGNMKWESLENGVGLIKLPESFQRLISFQMADWAHPVNVALDVDSPRYIQQSNPILRGTPFRPIAFLTNGGEGLEFYTTKLPLKDDSIKEFRAFLLDTVDNTYPDKLQDITAWKTAELVLSAMNDVEAAQICQNHTKEILETL